MTQPNLGPSLRGQTILQYILLLLLLLLYLTLALAHAALAPLTTGPDELAHYEYARFIAEHGRLPVNNEERAQASYKSDQPPLYHLLAALPMSLVDPTGPPSLKRVSDSPRRQLIERTRHAWGLYNTEDEGWPYRAEVLRWQVGRWVAILLGAATVAVTFFIARHTFARLSINTPQAPRPTNHTNSIWILALTAAAVVAFIPRFILTGSMLNYETTVAFFSTLFLWVLLRVGCQVSRITHHAIRNTQYASRLTYHALLLGLFAGLAILAKLSAIILPLEAVIGLWLIGRAQNWPRVVWLKTSLLTLVVTALVVSLWFGFVVYHFNTVAADGLWTGLLRPLIAADASDATTNRLLSFMTGGQAGFTGAIDNLESGPPWAWAAIFFRTFWMAGIEQVEPLVPSALIIALALCLAAAAGLILNNHRLLTTDYPSESTPRFASLLPTTYPRLLLSLLTLHLALPFILPLLRYAVTFSLADTAQGRHVLFSAAPAFAMLLVWGLFGVKRQVSGVIPQASRFTFYALRFIPFLPVLLVLTWTAAQLWTMTWAYNPPLPVTTQTDLPTPLAQQVNRPLNQYVTLAGYNQQLDSANRVLRLDLVWRATALSLVDYLTEVSLLDAQGQVQAQWLGYAANGRYPTRAWDVGDWVRDTIWLPVAGLAPGTYQLRLNLIPTSRSYPADQAVTPFTLTEVTLAQPALRLFNAALPFTDQAVTAAGFSLWQKGEVTTGLHTFNYRETIVVTLSNLLPDQQRIIRLVGPVSSTDQPSAFAPARELPEAAVFIVGPDWPAGDYHLQVTLTGGSIEAQQVNSDPLVRVVDLWQRQYTEPAMSQRVEANFAGQVKLLGYDLGANRANPGGGIPLTLYWQGLDWLGHDYTIFTKLLAADQSVHGGRDRLPREGYRTSYWAPGEIVSDPFGLPVDPDAPDGVYTINIGLYRQVEQQAVSLPLVQAGQPIDATSINIGPIKIGSAPPGVTLKIANPQIPLHQPFGDPPNLTLLGYDINNCQLTIDNPQGAFGSCQLSIVLYWRSESPLPLDYTTFVHLRNEAGQTVAQKDQPPLNGAYPTSLWDPGEIIADKLELPLPADLLPGSYTLVIGWYDLKSGARLPVPGHPDNSLTLQSVELGR